jgi:hypothetical protein
MNFPLSLALETSMASWNSQNFVLFFLKQTHGFKGAFYEILITLYVEHLHLIDTGYRVRVENKKYPIIATCLVY